MAPVKSDASCVLVVEDDSMVRVFIADHLRDQGYVVVEAETGEEALSLLRVERQPPTTSCSQTFSLGGN